MSEKFRTSRTSRNRATKAARCLTSACEPLEHRRLLSAYGSLAPIASFVPFPNGENPWGAATFDTAGNLWGTTTAGGVGGDGTVYEIIKGSGTITTVASFNGTNGYTPYAGVTSDASGNLWGTTFHGGTGSVGDDGTVYEIVKGSGTITNVANFNSANGSLPQAGVSFDASGNLWGTTYRGGTSQDGTVYEIAKGSSTISTVATFNVSNGADPTAAVTFDSSDNLWGTAYSGGVNEDGTVFEITKGSTTLTTIASFNGSNGKNPDAAVRFDASGNLWGTTAGGGAYDTQSNGDGTVFEIAKGSSTITTVASFNMSNGFQPLAPVTFDSSGNLWGTTGSGGAGNDGTVFEITKGSSTITDIVGFNHSNGGGPADAVTFDASGNLWGTTAFGGASYSSTTNGDGTVFEIIKGSSTLTTVASFIETSGQYSLAGVSFDASGNLWGTTGNGGSGSVGSVFEIVKGSSSITTVASFNNSNGEFPQSSVTFDAGGNLWGTTSQGGVSADGTIFEIAKGSSIITTVASFNGTNGKNPATNVTFDASGNLWGTNAGVGNGLVYEIAKGTSTITTVASFSGSNGKNPEAALTLDASGNFWGTTQSGGAYNDGSVFKIANGSSTIITVASFNGTNGSYPVDPVTFDASGNIWGTTPGSGASGDGEVFEIVKGGSTINIVASFNFSNGYETRSAVVFDPSGDLWGTSYNGGANSQGTVFEIVKGTSAISNVTSFSGTNGDGPSTAAVDSSGNIWGTTNSGGIADAGNVWEVPSLVPTWLSDPAGNDTWNSISHILTVNDSSTIIADPGSDQPIIEANGSANVVTINPSTALQIHIGGLSLTNGASTVVTSLSAERTATNHRVLVLGQPGAASAPLFTIDAASKLDLTDNDLVDHDGSLASVSALLTTGFAGGWTGHGIVSSKASGSVIYTLGVGQPASAGTFDSESVGTSDVEIRYTYYGDANLDGRVDGGDYSKIDSGLLNHLTGWSNGDFNYDGAINGSDYALIDNAFNTQGASLAASIAQPKASTASGMTLSIGRSRTVSYAPDFFSTGTPIALTESTEQGIELSIQKRDLLDRLSFTR